MDPVMFQNNYNLMCRLCLSSDENLLSIFDENNIYLPQRIAACVNVEVYKGDKVSTKICRKCLVKVNNWFDFKKCCDDSQSKLRRLANFNLINYKGFGVPLQLKEELLSEPDPDEIQIVENDICIKEEPDETEAEDNYSLLSETEDEPTDFSFELSAKDSFLSPPDLSDSLLVPNYECPAQLHGVDRSPPSSEVKEEGTRQCRVCFKEFSTISNRQRHEKESHTKLNSSVESADNDKISQRHEKEAHTEPNSSIESADNDIILEVDNNSVDYSYQEWERNIGLKKPTNGKHFVEFHRVIGDMIKKSTCIMCGIQRSKILDHLHKKVYIDRFTCYSCFISLGKRSSYAKHRFGTICVERASLISESNGMLKPYQHYQCSFCLDFYGHVSHMNAHLISSHLELEENFPPSCEKCDKQYENYDDYKNHLQSVCFYATYCSICKKPFHTDEEFYEHCSIHEGDIGKFNFDDYVNKEYNCKVVNKYSCSRCGEQFPSFELWCEHQKTHYDTLNQCLECERVFATVEELNEHKTKHPNNNIKLKLYRCSSTNSYKSIPDYSKTKSEMQIINVENSNSIKKFTCRICFKEYDRQSTFKSHMYGHRRNKGDKDYVSKKRKRVRCSKCHQLVFFTQLKTHICSIKVPDNEYSRKYLSKKYKCHFCSKQYCSSTGYTYHVQRCPNVEGEQIEKPGPASSKPIIIDNDEFNPGSSSIIVDNEEEMINPGSPSNELPILPVSTSTYEKLKTRPSSGRTAALNTNKRISDQLSTEWDCELCEKKFTSNKAYKLHIKLCDNHLLSENLPVKIKTEPTESAASLNLNSNTVFRCTSCYMEFSSKAALNSHAKLHLNGVVVNYSFNCKFCPVACTSQTQLSKHIAENHDPQNPNKNLNQMSPKIQIKKEFPTREMTFECKECNKFYVHRGSLAKHKKRHHNIVNNVAAVNNNNNKKRKFKRVNKVEHKCKQCSQIFPTIFALKEHIQFSCYYCGLCKKPFSTKSGIVAHIAKHPAKPTFKCETCAEVFYFHKDYVLHLREHKKPYKCKICTKSYATMKVLLAHCTSEHGEGNIKKKIVKNPVSFKKIKVKKEITEVQVRKEIKKEVQPQPQRAAYRCTECNVTFVNSKKLREHILSTHMNEV